jgi:hypothetical protein
MKTKLVFFSLLALVFGGCDLIKDATEVTIETDLNADIPVVVTSPGKGSADQVLAAPALSFTKTQDLSLSSNADIEPYLSKIEDITLNGLVITVTGLTTGQTINSVALDVTGVGNIFTQTNITMTNNSFTPTIAAGKLDQVAVKLTTDKKITLTVSGSASGPMTFTVKASFDASILAAAL